MIRLLASPLSSVSDLPSSVEECAAQGCVLIAIYGLGSEELHDAIDNHLLYDFAEDMRRPEQWSDIVTTWHPGRQDALGLVRGWDSGIHVIEDATI